MKLVGKPGGLTDKGCLPPLQIVQGDFDMNLTALPEVAFDKCIGGSGRDSNFTVNVNSTAGWAALSFINPGAQHPLLVTIDNHELYVFQIDGQYVVPTVVDQIRLWQIEGERMDVHSGFLIKDVGSAEDYERAVRYADALGVLKKEFRNKGWFFVSRMDQMSTYFKGLSARRREAQMAAR